jgi:hypothetical protein
MIGDKNFDQYCFQKTLQRYSNKLIRTTVPLNNPCDFSGDSGIENYIWRSEAATVPTKALA